MCLYYLLMERERGVQGHQAFAFCVVNVNDEPCKTKVQKKAQGLVKFKGGVCAELGLKLGFESDWYFCNTTESEWF